MRDSEALDRSSFVPLYYQLQELVKEQIESGGWRPGDRLPSEPELARRYAVSRVVVRQALAILQDDGQIVRVQGRGTFVAEPKLDARAGGLARLLATPRPPDVTIDVLEAGTPPVEPVDPKRAQGRRPGARAQADHRSVRPGDPARDHVLVLPCHGCGLAGGRRAASAALVPRELVLADHGIELAGSSLSIETSQCGQFEADFFGIRIALPSSSSSPPSCAGSGMAPSRSRLRGSSIAATCSSCASR